MTGADGSPDGIIQQDHVAVGGEYHQRQMGYVGDHAIHGGVVPVTPKPLTGVRFRHMAHHILVDLFGQHHAVHICPQGGAEPAIVFADVLDVIAAAHT